MSFRLVILAAGKGTRMNSNIPKALMPVCGKPIIQYLHESVIESGIDDKPIIVVGHERAQLCDCFGGNCQYVAQEKQLGTAHAVMSAREAIGDAGSVIVLYGDHPFVSSSTLRQLVALHQDINSVLTIITTKIPSFDGWYSAFKHWGRIFRNGKDQVIGIREYKDASEVEREIKEVNPALYCFNTSWLWQNIHKIQNKNASGEYYLTDLVELAVQQGHHINSMPIPPEETIGINTPEELKIAEAILHNNKHLCDI